MVPALTGTDCSPFDGETASAFDPFTEIVPFDAQLGMRTWYVNAFCASIVVVRVSLNGYSVSTLAVTRLPEKAWISLEGRGGCQGEGEHTAAQRCLGRKRAEVNVDQRLLVGSRDKRIAGKLWPALRMVDSATPGTRTGALRELQIETSSNSVLTGN